MILIGKSLTEGEKARDPNTHTHTQGDVKTDDMTDSHERQRHKRGLVDKNKINQNMNRNLETQQEVNSRLKCIKLKSLKPKERIK